MNHGIVFSDMPDIVLLTVMDNLDFRSIIILRKVCQRFQSFIDETSPPFSISEMTLAMNARRFRIEFYDPCAIAGQNVIKIKYKHSKRGCLIAKKVGDNTKERLLQNQNFFDCLWRDFQFILKHQKSALRHFSISFEHFQYELGHLEANNLSKISLKFIQNLEEYFKSRTKLFPIKHLEMKVSEEIITITKGKGETNKVLELDEVAELQQWKVATGIEISHHVTLPMKHFAHFSKVEISLETVSQENLRSVMKILLGTPAPELFLLNHKTNSVDKIKEVFGNPYGGIIEDHENDKCWFFQIPGNNDEVLFVYSTFFSRVSFKRVSVIEVPFDVVFQNFYV
ncbi:hypothetical protein CRE_09445 [Caenorhabditis remanei]|uniref:F-box domain-containing protein n=1 Tax=Caenorhabditis remanei TaxID=31234 RepID=E3LIW5_CAERE|nr:hypothetical protein CRE_09445 [Caenorhabditis remanei]